MVTKPVLAASHNSNLLVRFFIPVGYRYLVALSRREIRKIDVPQAVA
jgi:hypothetical protein